MIRVGVAPCLMCMGVILAHRIGRVIFGSGDSRGDALGVFGHMPPAFENHLRALEKVDPQEVLLALLEALGE